MGKRVNLVRDLIGTSGHTLRRDIADLQEGLRRAVTAINSPARKGKLQESDRKEEKEREAATQLLIPRQPLDGKEPREEKQPKEEKAGAGGWKEKGEKGGTEVRRGGEIVPSPTSTTSATSSPAYTSSSETRFGRG